LTLGCLAHFVALSYTYNMSSSLKIVIYSIGQMQNIITLFVPWR